MNSEVTEKAKRRIEKYLTQRGMKILERDWTCNKDKIDFIANDNGELVFVSCNIQENDDDGLGGSEVDRRMFERISLAYLVKHPDLPESAVRLDVASMTVVEGGKALLRLHVNALADTADLK